MFFSAAVMKTNPISYHRGLVFMDRPEVTEAVGKIRFMERCLMLDESMKFMALARISAAPLHIKYIEVIIIHNT